jgi:3-hydroxymyristoyl/3-hydroxydecanoyl-(acyl carrier protein) dehydratase
VTAEAAKNRTISFEPASAPHTYRATLAPDLVYFEGHFDGFALLPAVAQLARVVMPLIRREHPDLGDVQKLRRARFKRPLRPEETITVTLSRGGAEARVSFEISAGAELAASGTLDFKPPAGVLPPRSPAPV